MAELQWLANVLLHIDEQDWTHELYVEGAPPFQVRTRCLVLEEGEEPEQPPELARRHGLRRALSVHQAQGVVHNARAQKPEVGAAELVAAFNYYFEHDAFLVLTK
jgi:hypothetical protein